MAPIEPNGGFDSAELDMISAWKNAQLMPWLGKQLSSEIAEQEFSEVNLISPSAFVFRFESTGVTLVDKPLVSQKDLPTYLVFKERADAYMSLFEKCTTLYPLSHWGSLIMDMQDYPLMGLSTPVFSFQKRRGSNSLLLPDTEFVGRDFYRNDDIFVDRNEYYQKMDRAIFAGSTSGGHFNTTESLRCLDNPRINAAVHFSDSGLVDFLLPSIVQCDSKETEELMRAHGFGYGTMLYDGQFKYKFLISMDGNGATCSRVFASLRSKSCLLKYASDNLLIYSDSLLPWVHYVPIYEHDDVEKVIELEKRTPGTFKNIAENGSDFAKKFLREDVLLKYSSEVIDGYMSLFSPAASYSNLSKPAYTSIKGLGHVAGVGDVLGKNWIGIPHRGAPLEGFIIFSEPKISWDQIEYSSNGEPFVKGGLFSGTRGEGKPIDSIVIRLPPGLLSSFHVEASFVDGTSLDVVPLNGSFEISRDCPIEAIRLTFL